MSSVVEMIPMIQALTAADQWAMLEQLVSVLKGAGPLKVKPSKASKKTAKALDENGEPKEKRPVRPDSYIHLLHKVVSPALTAMAEITEDEAEKKMLKSVTARAQIAKTLYETVKAITNEDKTVESELRATAIMEISKESVADAFQAWKADPPAVEYKGKKAAKVAAAAAAAAVIAAPAAVTVVATATELYLGAAPAAIPVVAAAPKIIKTKVIKPKVEKVAKPELSEEEKAAKKKAVAKAAYEKAKAKKAAEKAAGIVAPAAAPTVAAPTVAAPAVAAPATVAAPASAVIAVEEVSCDPYIWEHNFGKGNLAYERIDFDGVAYIYEADTKTYLGVFQETTNSLDLSIPDPTAE